MRHPGGVAREILGRLRAMSVLSHEGASPGRRPQVSPAARAASGLDYRPRDPRSYRPGIALVGCGAVAEHHLTAYRAAGYRVVALCDLDRERAGLRQRQFYPEASVHGDVGALLRQPDVEVVDIATHPAERLPIMEAALRARKHVLSQKPFVEDLRVGRRLVNLADSMGVRLAVNQNGRWAPHLSYLRTAVASGLLGRLVSVEFSVAWDHNWVVGTPFDHTEHLILCDFAIHWFDLFTALFTGRRPLRVHASVARSPSQRARQPLLAQAVVEYEGARALLAFNGDSPLHQGGVITVQGTAATIHSSRPDLYEESLVLRTERGSSQVVLQGKWFPDGFHGSMGELLCSIEEDREPEHGARGNLESLALCFAACASSVEGIPKVPGRVLRLP